MGYRPDIVTVGELIKNLQEFKPEDEVMVTVNRPCECGKNIGATERVAKVGKYHFMPKETHPNDYWVQLTVNLEE